ncbi:MAG TPA: LptF/LptG family permease [Rhizomicrobium sp.]|jgi:lipopolysaccharide export LptBFGC system permease protein LptF
MTAHPVAEPVDRRSRIRKFGVRITHGVFTHLYARQLFGSVILQAFAVMALVEAIFLAERFPIVFRDVLKNNASLLDTSLILSLASTQIFDLALAIAILMAVYWTVLRMRENRELLVIFAAGAGIRQIMALILAIALGAQICSLTVSGVIDPAARYAQRVILFNAKFHALVSGINTGQFYYFRNRVAYAPPPSTADRPGASSGQSRKLFVYEPLGKDSFRIVTADHAWLDGPDASGSILVKLSGFTSRVFSDLRPLARTTSSQCTGCVAQAEDHSSMMLVARDIVRETTADELLAFQPRGSEPAEWTIFEQLGAKSGATQVQVQEEMRLLGERFARSLLCLLAPLIALACVCFTARSTDYVALPLACMVLMSLNVTSEWLIRTIAPSGPLGALIIPTALIAIFMAVLFAVIARKQGELVRP